jgi:hypothetical protein
MSIKNKLLKQWSRSLKRWMLSTIVAMVWIHRNKIDQLAQQIQKIKKFYCVNNCQYFIIQFKNKIICNYRNKLKKKKETKMTNKNQMKKKKIY